MSDWITTGYKDGAYLMECQGATGGWRGPDWEITDAHILVDAKLLDGQGNDSLGVVFRERNGVYYEFTVNARGYYGFWYRTKSSVSVIVNWTYSEALNLVGTTNKLKIAYTDTTFTFTANGVQLLTVEDATLNSGTIGFAVNSAGIYPVKASFDNLQVWSN